MQVQVGKGYRGQLVQKEKRKEVIHYDCFPHGCQQNRGRNMSSGISQLARTSLKAEFQPHQQQKKKFNEHWRPKFLWIHQSTGEHTGCLVSRVAWWCTKQKKNRISTLGTDPNCCSFCVSRLRSVSMPFLSPLLCFYPPKNHLCLLALHGPCTEHSLPMEGRLAGLPWAAEWFFSFLKHQLPHFPPTVTSFFSF